MYLRIFPKILDTFFSSSILKTTLSACSRASEKRCSIFENFTVFPRLIKSPYKMYSLNIPYFMRVRKRFDAKKIRKIGWILDILAIFRRLGTAKMAIYLRKFTVGDAQQANRRSWFDKVGYPSAVYSSVVGGGAVADVHSALDSAETFFFEFACESVHVLPSAFAVPWKIKIATTHMIPSDRQGSSFRL